jgi:hypothetical protein
MPGTPFIALSRGVTTALTQVSALAPVYFVVTVTSGGAMSGNWVIGNCVSANAPNRVIINEITIDRTGLCINFEIIMIYN